MVALRVDSLPTILSPLHQNPGVPLGAMSDLSNLRVHMPIILRYQNSGNLVKNSKFGQKLALPLSLEILTPDAYGPIEHVQS